MIMTQRIHATMNDWRPLLTIPTTRAANADATQRFPGRVTTKLFHSAWLLLLLLLLAVCSVLSGCAGPVIATERIQIFAEADANQSTATNVDLVFIYDQAALGVLPRTGPRWFASKEALMRGLATDIEVVAFEVATGMQVNVSLPARSRSAIAVYSYANYLHPAGQAVGSLSPYRAIEIRLQRDRINYIAMP
jgi:type VI secretion system protein